MLFQGAQSPKNGTPLQADYFCVDGFCHLRKISCVCVERVVQGTLNRKTFLLQNDTSIYF